MSTQVTSATTKRRRKPMTPEQRQRDIERQRRFRREHPERCKEYRRRYIVKAAARIAEAEGKGGEANV